MVCAFTNQEVKDVHRSRRRLQKHPTNIFATCVLVHVSERWVKEDVGGRGHPLETLSRAATRVAKRSKGAETLPVTAGVEAAQRLVKFLDEVWNGAEGARGLRDRPFPIPIQLCNDAREVYGALRCQLPYHGADQSMSLYIAALKEDMMQGRLLELVWINTESCLADAMAKFMRDHFIRKLYQTGEWTPAEHMMHLARRVENAEGYRASDNVLDNGCEDGC